MKKISEIDYLSKKLNLGYLNTNNEDEILLFLKSFYKSFGKRVGLDNNWFKWYYINNPFGICENFVLTDDISKQLIGAFGFSPAQIRIKDQIKNIFIGVNGFINDPYTGKGLYTKLIKTGLNVLGSNEVLFFSFPHQNNLASIKGHEKSGWESIIKLQFLSKDLKLSTTRKKKPSDLKITENFTDLINYNFSSNAQGFLKSWNWIKWRFLERPDKDYHAIVLNQGNSVKAYVIYTLYKSPFNLRAQVTDYEVSNDLFLEPILNELELKTIEQGADTLEFLVNRNSEEAEQIKTNGYNYINDGYEMFQVKDYKDQGLDLKMKVDFSFFDVV